MGWGVRDAGRTVFASVSMKRRPMNPVQPEGWASQSLPLPKSLSSGGCTRWRQYKGWQRGQRGWSKSRSGEECPVGVALAAAAAIATSRSALLAGASILPRLRASRAFVVCPSQFTASSSLQLGSSLRFVACKQEAPILMR